MGSILDVTRATFTNQKFAWSPWSFWLFS